MKKFPLVKCPYCFESIRYNDAVFRCNIGMKRQDDYLNAYHMENGNFAFSQEDYDFVDPADLSKKQLEMDDDYRIIGVENPNPALHLPLEQRLCPYCHNDLLRSFGREETRYIAVVGVPSSGKTTYLAALNDRMRNQDWIWFSLDTEKSTPLDNVTDLYCANQPGIRVATKSIQGPYLYELNYKDKQTENSGKKPPQEMKSHIVFFDVPGEFYSDVNKISHKLSQFLEKADGIIFIINAAEEVEYQREMQKEEFVRNVETKKIVKVTDILQAFSQADIIKNKKTAIIFNKIDLIEKEINLNQRTKLSIFPGETTGPIDSAEIDNLSTYTISQILGEGAAIQNSTQQALSRYMKKINQVFGDDSKVFATRLIIEDEEDPQKYEFVSKGAETPFLWLLSEIGVYPKVQEKPER